MFGHLIRVFTKNQHRMNNIVPQDLRSKTDTRVRGGKSSNTSVTISKNASPKWKKCNYISSFQRVFH